MGKFERETLPKALVEAQAKVVEIEREMFGIAAKLDFDEEFRDHKCDCEFCESNNSDYRELDDVEREELEEKHEELATQVAAYRDEIGRMIRYKEFVEKAGIA